MLLKYGRCGGIPDIKKEMEYAGKLRKGGGVKVLARIVLFLIDGYRRFISPLKCPADITRPAPGMLDAVGNGAVKGCICVEADTQV